MQPEKIALRIIGIICDGRMTDPFIHMTAWWIAFHVRGTEAKNTMLTFAHSIISAIEENHDPDQEW